MKHTYSPLTAIACTHEPFYAHLSSGKQGLLQSFTRDWVYGGGMSKHYIAQAEMRMREYNSKRKSTLEEIYWIPGSGSVIENTWDVVVTFRSSTSGGSVICQFNKRNLQWTIAGAPPILPEKEPIKKAVAQTAPSSPQMVRESATADNKKAEIAPSTPSEARTGTSVPDLVGRLMGTPEERAETQMAIDHQVDQGLERIGKGKAGAIFLGFSALYSWSMLGSEGTGLGMALFWGLVFAGITTLFIVTAAQQFLMVKEAFGTKLFAGAHIVVFLGLSLWLAPKVPGSSSLPPPLAGIVVAAIATSVLSLAANWFIAKRLTLRDLGRR